jgi:hypothetical protein
MRSFVIASLVVLFGIQSFACKRSPESSARAQEAAVRSYLKADPKWSSYKVQSLKGRDGIYTIALKRKSKREKLQLEATNAPDCSVSVGLPTGP